MSKQFLLAIAVVVVSTSSLFAGGNLRVRVEGTITSIDDPTGVFAALSVGESITALYSYDVTLPDNDPDTTHGQYLEIAAADRFSLTVGSMAFSVRPTAPLEISVTDRDQQAGGDTFQVQAVVTDLPDCAATGSFLIFRDPSGAALSSDALLQDPPILNSFPLFTGFVTGAQCGPGLDAPIVNFDITSITAVAVPAVSEWGLAITALSLMACGTILLRWRASNRKGLVARSSTIHG